MKRALATYGKRGLVAVGVNASRTEELMLGHIDKLGLEWPHWFLGDDRAKAFERYWVRGLPTQLLVGRDGRIVARDIMLTTDEGQATLRKALGVSSE